MALDRYVSSRLRPQRPVAPRLFAAAEMTLTLCGWIPRTTWADAMAVRAPQPSARYRKYGCRG